MPAPLIRAATRADLPDLGRMGAQLAECHHAWDAARFMLPDDMAGGYRWWLGRELGNPEAVILVGEIDGNVVGYAYGRLEERDWNALLDACGGFHDLWVDEAARRSGLGASLARAMIAALSERGAPRIVLKTSTLNTAAQKLFTSLGWRPTMLEMTRERA
jgi:ribosomal protein S18 acetylase RimI-like enzyme